MTDRKKQLLLKSENGWIDAYEQWRVSGSKRKAEYTISYRGEGSLSSPADHEIAS